MSQTSGSEVDTVAILLVQDFSMLEFSAAIEPMRVANRLSGRTLYSWRILTEDGKPVTASNGVALTPHAAIQAGERHPITLVCAGIDGCHYRSKRIFGWLRQLARNDGRIAGIGTGAFLLARAGLLDGRRCTTHWEEIESFRHEFPRLEVTETLYEVDGDRLTCPGGTAALDMVLHLIGQHHGRDLAGHIAEEIVQHGIRDADEPQRMSLQSRTGICDARLLTAVAAMEANIEEPLSLGELCELSDLSLRHMQRLFMSAFKRSPTDFYRELRLRHARQMLLHGSQSILAVAVASGFVSGAHFTRRYRAMFGRSPRHERQRH